ncbi:MULTISPECIES: ABC transporter permease [unclassified Rhizobium]|uniref:ABC transporter permease n=1 Tax=unclassified Rhizobium TaxID=2613769 RepID=UPI0016078C23|nr:MULTISPECIES: ABC transporter permease [unclassified Rhizobium]MBB3287209.1 putative ABC transport system permease protein [Rhizobium sp. BK252]MBB3401949.1 putative ABC transport system permease protein [Rhizobium sp. BK289]MBB3414107.1 putative ABC transport system permease protein [Rhizobium sp. BK284]MBB3481994.1 putative ABC transport system permease protein [Rhizobium sp. BK347]
MSLIALSGACEAGLLFALVALGVYLSFRVLDFPDLTVDGSFPLGASVAASTIMAGVPPIIATLLGFAAGASAGFVTAFLSVRLKIMNLLAGILTMVALFSINLRVMGKPNVSLYGTDTIFSRIDGIAALGVWTNTVLLLCIVLAAKMFVDWFLATQMGLALRATGASPRMAEAQAVDNSRMVMLGMALANGLVGLAGALYAESQGVADVSMGIGTIVTGLAAVIIGETVVGAGSVARATFGCILGALIYRLVIALALDGGVIGIQAQDLNLVTALVVAVAVMISKTRLKKLPSIRRTRLPEPSKAEGTAS